MIRVFKNRKIKRIAFVFLIFFISRVAVFAQADLVIINADIRTIDKTKPRAEAVAVVKNRIAAVGTNRQIRALSDKNTKIIDARGRLVLPGFNDAHVHFAAMGKQFFGIDLRDAKSPSEMAERIKFYARFLPRGHWILGGGWNNENWTPDDLPTRDLIDSAAPENPVFIYHSNAKTALVNSLALKLARVDKSTKDTAGGEIKRDSQGEPTGILKDSAMTLVRRFAPQFTIGDELAAAETATNYAAAFGVTSVQDVSSDDNSGIYRELARQEKLKTRVYDCIALSGWQKLARIKKESEPGAMIRRGCLKGMADGDADSTEALYEEILAADKAGLQVMIHAIGGRANEQILSIFERVRRVNGRRDRRFRVEHAHGFRPPDIKRFSAADIIASVQPFLFSDPEGKSFDPLRSLIDNRTRLAFGSDSTMIPVNPLFGIAAAADTNNPQQKITVEEAVRFYTLGAAFAEFQENEKGSIAAGKLADFVILSDDIFAINPADIRRARVLTTIVDGRVVFQSE